MGFWDVLLFNIATVLGPRWIAAAGHNGTSSISLWVLAAVFFFVPGALVINELSSRFPEEGGLYVWSARSLRRLPRLHRRLDLLDLHLLLLPRAAARQRLHGRLHHRTASGSGLAGRPHFPALGFAGPAARRRGAQHRRPQHRQVAAERRRRRHLCPSSDPCRRRHCCPAPRPGYGSATHFTLHNMLPGMELGHGQLLVPDRLRLYRSGTGLGHERRDSRSPPHPATRGLWRRRPHRLHVHCRNLCHPRSGARSGHRSAERRLPRHHRRLSRSQSRLPRHPRRGAGHRGQRRRSRLDRRRHRARSLRRRRRPLPAGGLRQDPSALENSVGFDPGSGSHLRSHPARQPDQSRACAAPISF